MTVSAGGYNLIDDTDFRRGVASARISDSQILTTYRNANSGSNRFGARVSDIDTGLLSFTPNTEQLFAETAADDNHYLIPLSSTKFAFLAANGNVMSVLTVSGITVTQGPRNTTLTDTPNNSFGSWLAPLSSTSFLWIYVYGTGSSLDIAARVMTIDGSDNITEGARNTLYTDPSTIGWVNYGLFDTSTGAFFMQDANDNFYLKGQLFTISGSTVATSGGLQSLYTAKDGFNSGVSVAELSSSEMIVSHSAEIAGPDQSVVSHVISLSGSTLSAGATLELDSTEFNTPETAITTNNTTILVAGNPDGDTTTTRVLQLIKDGATLSYSSPDYVDFSITDNIQDRLIKIVDDFAFITTAHTAFGTDSVNGAVIGSDSAIEAVAGELTMAPARKPCDVNADGDFLYIAAINSLTFPTLVKISTDLDADGSVVFNPAAGDNIGVECGRFDANVVYVAGSFGGTDVIEKSDDAGSSFAVIDDGTIGDIRAFVVGPDNDNRVLIFDETNGDILETTDAATWTAINASVTPEINAIARLGRNVQECVFGNEAAATDSINYSPNSGDDLEDYQTGDYPQASATRVIVI